MNRALSNLIALVITTAILVAASSIVIMRYHLVLSALKPQHDVSLKAICSKVMNSSLYLCIIRSSVRYCGKLHIITENGTLTLNRCIGPRLAIVLALASKPIAVRVDNKIKLVEVR